MSRFIQLHALTVYPLSNPNRDDTGRPKSATYGGVPRLRLSSQALKRAIRMSSVFQSELDGHLGERTQRIGDVVMKALAEQGVEDEERRLDIAETVTGVFGKIDAARMKEDGAVRTRQLAFISPDERRRAIELAEQAAAGEKMPSPAELKKEILRTADGAADIAMFGRMLADDPGYNREAAVQLAHAFTTHRVIVEDDFYTAVDDLKEPAEDTGAGFIGETGFGSGVFYLYGCIDRDLLERNLEGDAALASRAIAAFVSAFTSATPSGKRTTFAHQTRASYLLAEKGEQQPRSLAAAFLSGVHDDDLLIASIDALDKLRDALDNAYGPCADARVTLNVSKGESTIADVIAFAAEG